MTQLKWELKGNILIITVHGLTKTVTDENEQNKFFSTVKAMENRWNIDAINLFESLKSI